RPHRRRWTAGSHFGGRWSSRLVATPSENRLNFRRNAHASIAAASDCRTIAIYEYMPYSQMSSKLMTGKAALVCGAGGFIGHHLVKRLKREGFWVRGADLKFPRFSETEADDFMVGDLRDPYFVQHAIDRRFSEIYQLAADMGGAGYIFTGEHDADVMHNSASI